MYCFFPYVANETVESFRSWSKQITCVSGPWPCLVWTCALRPLCTIFLLVCQPGSDTVVAGHSLLLWLPGAPWYPQVSCVLQWLWIETYSLPVFFPGLLSQHHTGLQKNLSPPCLPSDLPHDLFLGRWCLSPFDLKSSWSWVHSAGCCAPLVTCLSSGWLAVIRGNPLLFFFFRASLFNGVPRTQDSKATETLWCLVFSVAHCVLGLPFPACICHSGSWPFHGSGGQEAEAVGK